VPRRSSSICARGIPDNSVPASLRRLKGRRSNRPRSCRSAIALQCNTTSSAPHFAHGKRHCGPLGDAAWRKVQALKEQTKAMTSSPRYVLATHVKAGRDDDFETFMREVVVPAEVQARPHLVGM
jgi:hypothetical protein